MHIDKFKCDNTCKGLVFKCRISSWFDLKHYKISEKKELYLLKRKSCSGCNSCAWLYETFGDMNSDGDVINDIINFDIIENNKLYMISICNVSHDWETGHIDSYDLQLTEIK